MKMSALAIKNNYFAYLNKVLKKYKPAEPLEKDEETGAITEMVETKVTTEKVENNA